MDLPETLDAREITHGHGAKGMALYIYADSQDLGVVQFTQRPAGNKPFTSILTFKWLPGEEFTSYAALRIAVSALTPEMIAAEKAKWPQLMSVVQGDHPANKCTRHRDRPSVMRATVQRCWLPFLSDTTGLCAECAPAATGNGQGVADIMDERRAYVRSLPPLAERLKGLH